MKHKTEVWGWLLAVDFFCAGMGGGMLVVTGLAGLFSGPGATSLLGDFAGPALVALGASFLILELGRPLQAWRVFLNPKAILTIGAWAMTLAIGCGLIYATFGIAAVPWAGWDALRQLLAVGCVVVGLVVAAYPGVLLGRHKSRPFWTGPGIMALFLLSSLLTGLAGHLLAGVILPASGAGLIADLPGWAAGLLGGQLLLWPGYVWIKRTGTTDREAAAAQRWVRGDLSNLFWLGLVGGGTVLPLGLFLLPGVMFQAIGAVLALLGGALMRWLVVRSGETRTWLPGEEKYRANLPHGDEAFLQAWK